MTSPASRNALPAYFSLSFGAVLLEQGVRIVKDVYGVLKSAPCPPAGPRFHQVPLEPNQPSTSAAPRVQLKRLKLSACGRRATVNPLLRPNL